MWTDIPESFRRKRRVSVLDKVRYISKLSDLGSDLISDESREFSWDVDR